MLLIALGLQNGTSYVIATSKKLWNLTGMTSIYETNEVLYYFTIDVNANLGDKCIAFPVAPSQ